MADAGGDGGLRGRTHVDQQGASCREAPFVRLGRWSVVGPSEMVFATLTAACRMLSG